MIIKNIRNSSDYEFVLSDNDIEGKYNEYRKRKNEQIRRMSR
jgi:hypothetical protein